MWKVIRSFTATAWAAVYCLVEVFLVAVVFYTAAVQVGRAGVWLSDWAYPDPRIQGEAEQQALNEYMSRLAEERAAAEAAKKVEE